MLRSSRMCFESYYSRPHATPIDPCAKYVHLSTVNIDGVESQDYIHISNRTFIIIHSIHIRLLCVQNISQILGGFISICKNCVGDWLTFIHFHMKFRRIFMISATSIFLKFSTFRPHNPSLSTLLQAHYPSHFFRVHIFLECHVQILNRISWIVAVEWVIYADCF